MALAITLKNAAGANVVYTESGHDKDTVTFLKAGASLLDSSKLALTLRRGGNTNRVVAKLSIPSVGVVPSTGVPGVKWTEVGSFDLSAVLAADTEAATDFMAQFASLAGSDVVKRMYTTGVLS